jgi:uridine kinase
VITGRTTLDDVDLLDGLGGRIEALLARRDRVLVAVDGPDAAGKTTLADGLAARLAVPTVRASVDGFHHPRAVRHHRGPLSPEGYYRNSFDDDALVDALLEPFAEGAPQVRTQVFDHRLDALAEVTASGVPVRAALVVDGLFLLRPALRYRWDLAVYLHVLPEETVRRARVRDAAEMGGTEEVERRYAARYLPGQALYRAEARPLAVADVIIDNTDPAAPQVVRW